MGNVVNQAQLVRGEVLRSRSRVNVKVRERKETGALPLSNAGLDLGRPHKIRLVRRGRTILSDRSVVVRTTDLVLCAVAALGKAFITTNVATLAVQLLEDNFA